MTACTQPGCTGTIEDGYCDVCGAPQGAAPMQRAAPLPPATPAASAAPSAPSPTQPRAQAPASNGQASSSSTKTSSSRLASVALGSARTARGSATVRRAGSISTRLKGARLGAGLTTVPSEPPIDPTKAVLTDAELPESKRFCPQCGAPVGRSRDGKPGRTEGFCPKCGGRFVFSPQLHPGDLVANQYEVAGALAYGGLGWIYLARDRNVSGRWVVLKGLLNAGDPDAYAAAISERRFLAQVEHPLIVEIYNFVMFEGAGYTVMEYVGGTSLKDILKKRRAEAGGAANPLPVAQALAYVLEILPAFAYLHDLGLLYCDFKPDNMIQVGDAVKLIDLGGVRRIDDLTSPIYGTIGYQAPEVADVGPSVASDIYTIGRTLAALTLDFKGNQSTYVASLPPVESTPTFARYDGFYRLLAKACALNPDDRFGSVEEMRNQLLGVLREVVTIDAGDSAQVLEARASVYFTAPSPDVNARPLPWQSLPRLKVDPDDPMSDWLASLDNVPPARRQAMLAAPPEATVETRLAWAWAAIHAGDFALSDRIGTEILAQDAWEWRAVWLRGLADLARGEMAGAQAAFNTVYGQVPGELAPKLALATACELSQESDIAMSLYGVVARTDANYTAPAAFGMARIHAQRKDLDGALAALDLVPSSRAAYGEARRQRAELLAASGRGLPALGQALAALDDVVLDPLVRADFTARVFQLALDLVLASGRREVVTVGGVPTQPNPLRDALEKCYRQAASLAQDSTARYGYVDRANSIRRWTTT